VAEDNTVNQKVAVNLLRKADWTADVVSNGLEVLEAVNHVRYDAILMDCQMPELDGYETTRRIRGGLPPNSPNVPTIPIVAMTANAMTGDRERCLQAGMDDYVSKPVRFDDLKAAIQNLLPVLARPGSVLPASPQPADAASPMLDQDIVAGLKGLRDPGQPDPLAELLDLFAADAPAQLERIRLAVAVRDPDALHSAAHALKGSCANLGAQRLADLCLLLEEKGKAADWTDVEALAAQTSSLLPDTIWALRAEFGVAA
jgi:CheY-like chemotaxis protein/HPt (histidine-containing phosphotransfer) domain-containing protein